MEAVSSSAGWSRGETLISNFASVIGRFGSMATRPARMAHRKHDQVERESTRGNPVTRPAARCNDATRESTTAKKSQLVSHRINVTFTCWRSFEYLNSRLHRRPLEGSTAPVRNSALHVADCRAVKISTAPLSTETREAHNRCLDVTVSPRSV